LVIGSAGCIICRRVAPGAAERCVSRHASLHASLSGQNGSDVVWVGRATLRARTLWLAGEHAPVRVRGRTFRQEEAGGS